MKSILVVEDNPKHIESARRDLSDRGDLVVVRTYRESVDFLNNQLPDVVITDERIPFSTQPVYPLSRETFTGMPLPLGAKIVLYALAKGVPYIALVTDVSHHDDEVAATQDDFSRLGLLIIGDSRFDQSFRFCRGNVKDYAGIFSYLTRRENGTS